MIIVTGGAGFIGSNLIKYLNNIGLTNILVVDNLKNGTKYTNLVDLNISDYIDKEDFIEKIIANNEFGNIEVIFHQGACSSTLEWNGNYMMKNNYQYSKFLLHYCIERTIPFLYASSAAIYGNRINNIEHIQYEAPLNIYGYSKFLFDQYVRSIYKKNKSQILGLRYFNVYGPREINKGSMASVIFHLNNNIKNNESIKLFVGSEKFKRDFIYISDVIAVNIWAWKNKISGIFNCGTGISTSFKEIADLVLDLHKQGHIEYVPFPEILKGRYQIFTKANLTKLRIAGYNKSFKTVIEGIKEYIYSLSITAK